MDLNIVMKKITDNFYIRWIHYIIKHVIPAKILGDKRLIQKAYKKVMGYDCDLDNPQTLNEKISWLKLHDHRDFCTMCADKYRVREYYKKNFGEEYLVPLLYKTDRWQDISEKTLPNEPCVVKANTGTGTFEIIHDKSKVDFKKLRNECRRWMYINHYYQSQEWHYKNIKPCIIIEKLLVGKNGSIPNDYKLHYINGKLQFIYCVVDREGKNYRAIFSPDWELMPFQWVSKKNYKEITEPITEPRPASLDKMIQVGNKIAENFKYVRVDFYDVDGKMYYGEITLYHGSGHNKFYPEKYDKIYGDLLKL